MKVNEIGCIVRGKFVTLKELADNYNWPVLEAQALADLKRFSNLDDKALDVCTHCVIVAELVFRLTEGNKEAAYFALHHEIDEAFGLGDLTYTTKWFLFKTVPACQQRFKEYRNYLYMTFFKNRYFKMNEYKDVIKQADLMSFVIELEQFENKASISKCIPYEKVPDVPDWARGIFYSILNTKKDKDSIKRLFLQMDAEYRRGL